MKRYRVVIPYYMEFRVTANFKKEALSKAHRVEGHSIGYNDNQAKIEEEDCDNNTKGI